MQTQKIIESLGYSRNEARVYLAALSLGECHVTDIALKVKLPRSSTQVIVDKLHKEGLMSFYVKNRYKYWVAENPEHLLEKLKSREEMLRDALPELERLRRSRQGSKPGVKVFLGRDEIAQVYDDIIATKHHVLALIPEDKFLELFAETSIVSDYIVSRVKHFLKARLLAPPTPAGRKLLIDQQKKLREVRILPERVTISAATFIYGNKVAFISFNKRQPTAVMIEDPDIRETNELLFEELWAESVAS